MAGGSATYPAVVGPIEEVASMADLADLVELAGYSFVGAWAAGDYDDDWNAGGDDSIGRVSGSSSGGGGVLGGGHVFGGGEEKGGEEVLDGITEHLVITLVGFFIYMYGSTLRSYFWGEGYHGPSWLSLGG